MGKKIIVTDSYFESVFRLSHPDRRRVFAAIKDLSNNPRSSSFSVHAIERVKCDETFRSARVNDNLRIIFSAQGEQWVLLYVDQHDDAYKWCEGKYLKKTNFGAEYLYDEAEYQRAGNKVAEQSFDFYKEKPLLEKRGVRQKDLIRLGIAEIHAKTLLTITDDDAFIEYVMVFPAELHEGLLDIVAGTKSYHEVFNELNAEKEGDDFTAHRDTRRRFYGVDCLDELEMLMENDEFEKWKLFLHPSQENIVKRNFKGPTRIEGGPGTGKTVVGIHRAVYLAKHIYKKADGCSILLCTYSKKLANYIEEKVSSLCAEKQVENNITVVGFDSLVDRLLTANGIDCARVDDEEIKRIFASTYQRLNCADSKMFYKLEFDEIINKYDIQTLDEYLQCDRTGMGKPLDSAKRRAVWPFFERVNELMKKNNCVTFLDRARILLNAIRDGKIQERYDSIIIDEAQDFEPLKIKLLSELTANKENAVLILSDENQRIFKMSSWKKETDLNIVGRSYYLSINYRTTKQINDFATRQFAQSEMMKSHITEYKSISVGDEPTVQQFISDNEQIKYIVELIKRYINGKIEPYQIVIICANNNDCMSIKGALSYAGIKNTHLQGDYIPKAEGGVNITTASGVKGLEFEVAVIYNYSKFNKENIPGVSEYSDDKRIECLKYVASTRARAQLTITYVSDEE